MLNGYSPRQSSLASRFDIKENDFRKYRYDLVDENDKTEGQTAHARMPHNPVSQKFQQMAIRVNCLDFGSRHFLPIVAIFLRYRHAFELEFDRLAAKGSKKSAQNVAEGRDMPFTSQREDCSFCRFWERKVSPTGDLAD